MAAVEQAIENVPIAKLKIAADNVRGVIDDEELAGLAASIKAVGVLEPLLVTTDGVIVAGARRWLAAKAAGLKNVPCMRRAFTDQERLEIMLIENLQREDLTPLEEAMGFRRLVDLGLTQTQIADKVGCSQGRVSKRLSLLTLPEEVQKVVDSGEIALESAQELARISDDSTLVTKLVQKAVRSADSPYQQSNLNQDVKREVDRRQKVKEMAAAARKLKKDGENVIEIEWDEYGFRATMPEGHAFVKGQTYQTSEVQMNPAEHAKLPCHAVAIDMRTLEALEVCTDKSKHPSPAEKLEKDRANAEKRREKEREEWEKSVDQRMQFAAGVAKGKTDEKLTIQLAMLALMEDGSYYAGAAAPEIACDLLGLADEVPLDEADETDYEQLLWDKSNTSVADRTRVVTALAMATIEPGLRYAHAAWGSTEVAYLRVLEQLGYKPHELELNAVALATDEVEDGDDGISQLEAEQQAAEFEAGE